MTIKETPLKGLVIIDPKVIKDDRGYFFESFRKSILTDRGFDLEFVQDNESLSNKGTVRGLHLQAPPFGQDKLLRVVRGSIYDVVVDVRKDSNTFGHSYGIELSGSNNLLFFIPQGFAHGFCCLEDETIVQYKCSNYYNRDSEMGVSWNDPELQINWPIDNPIVSDKDQTHPPLAEFVSPF